MLAILFALLASASNATGSVLQRMGAREAPPQLTMHFGLVLDLIRRPIWLFGFVAMLAAFICQATALTFGGLTLVQPFVVTELPLTLFLSGLVFRAPLERTGWLGVFAVSAGLVAVLLGLGPTESDSERGTWAWLWTCVASVGLGVVLAVAAMATRRGARAALFGAAAGLGFGFTAALMKGAMLRLTGGGWGALFTSWQLYAMAVVGVMAFFLYQNAQQSGTLVASQPPVTTVDPLSSVLYGVLLFGERVQGGLWLILTFVGIALIVAGSVAISHSPLATGDTEAERGARRPADIAADGLTERSAT